MKLELFSVYDSKAHIFNAPMFLRSKGEALRTFTDTANDPKSQIAKHPEDYSLHHIGSYDDNTGVVTPQNPENMGLASEYKKEISFPGPHPLEPGISN